MDKSNLIKLSDARERYTILAEKAQTTILHSFVSRRTTMADCASIIFGIIGAKKHNFLNEH